MTSHARIAVVGPGSVGCFFAAHLSATDAEVTACARRPFERYVVRSDTAPFEGPAAVLTDPEDVTAPFDWVLVGVKAHQTAGAAAWLDATCDANTVVVAMQNGVEAVDRLAPFVNGAAVLPAVVYCAASLVEPGEIEHQDVGRLIVPVSSHAEQLAALFEGIPPVIDVSDGHLTSAWVKLGINVAANGLTALTGRPIGVLAHPDLAEVAAQMLLETWTVGRAEGADLDLDQVHDYIARVAANSPDLGTSMLADAQAGRATEHDAIQGAVLRIGARHGISTPTVQTVHAILDARSSPS